MKIRCSCGTKYEFDVTPEMARNPVRFVCQNCGLDSSDYVNQLVRAEIAENFPEAVPKPEPAAPAAPRLKISLDKNPAEQPQAAPVSKYCQRHRGVLATEKCSVCGKPICPQCLEQFGFFCSPLCKNKADLQGIAVPVYAGQKFQVEKRFWRKTGLISGSIFAAAVLFFGVWIWYAWFGSVPHTWFSVRFPDDDRAYAGGAQLVGQDQIVFLHGGTLARYDLKTQNPVWSQELITPAQIAAAVKAESDAEAAANSGAEYTHHVSQDQIEREAKIGLQRELALYVSDQNIWVNRNGTLTRYDWDTGKASQEVPLTAAGGAGNNSVAGGLPVAGADNGQPLDPNKVEAQVQNMNLPARIALPALLGNASYEQQLEAALNDHPQHPQGGKKVSTDGESVRTVPGENGFAQFSTRLLEEHIVTHEAMKAAPKKSALDGDLNASQTGDVANEMLNEMQRNRGGDKVAEDESRYQVTVHLLNSPGAADWTNEVTGPPQLFVLKTVNVVAAGKTVIVLDKSNKKLWQAALTYNVSGGGENFLAAQTQFGEGPVVEHAGTLYVFDQAVLSAFDLTSGNARWRVPSVGVVGLFFDDAGDVYVNTTTGNPDDIKYSRQIDINKNTEAVLLKIDCKGGKILWNVKPGGFISYLSGKFIYTVQSYDPNPTDEEQLSDTLPPSPALLRIKRINPPDGRVLWDYERGSGPVAVQFHDNTIELVFKRSVQVLKYFAF